METLTNIHPADELAALREEIKQLTDRENELRQILLAEGADLNGDQYTVNIIPSTRETVNKNALIAEIGREAAQKFMSVSHIKTVKLVPRAQE